MSKAFFAGSFDPFTLGHKDISDRALKMFDTVVIAVGYNVNKQVRDDVKSRLEKIRRIYAGNPKVEVTSYTGLTAEAAKSCGATCLIRGLRDTRDFEYERNIAEVNRKIFGVETLLMYGDTQTAFISSTTVAELRHYGVDVAALLPPDNDKH